MHNESSTSCNTSDRRPSPGVLAPADSADRAPVRLLEKTGGWTRLERLRILWYRLRLTVQEMNYATRRMVELQAPWIADDRQR